MRLVGRRQNNGLQSTCGKKENLAWEARALYSELKNTLGIEALQGLVFAVEYLPGQYDQRADSAAQCIQLISRGERPLVRTAKLYVLNGVLEDSQLKEIKRYVINPVEAREASLDKPETLYREYVLPEEVEILQGFRSLKAEALGTFLEKYSLAMDENDLTLCRDYFLNEDRDPTMTEIRMIDTYWSDHCRHTTFTTEIDRVDFQDEHIKKTYEAYEALRKVLRMKDPVSLMNLATISARALREEGLLKNLEESEEINACTVRIQVDRKGRKEPWLLLFKNETHNHPTEIEPFGGAATCIGGAIRDPLAGRAYVYGAMRVTGAADPRTPLKDTVPGKLPQRKIVTAAAAGYSSYGNQIGLATGIVDEVYHRGYVAKRMEIRAVIGAVPQNQVMRQSPMPGGS